MKAFENVTFKQIILLILAVTLLACKDTSNASSNNKSLPVSNNLSVNVAPVTNGNWYKPTVGTSWQWQLQPKKDEELNLSYNVEIYDLDLFDTPAKTIQQLQEIGHKVICYFSAGSYENWRLDEAQFMTSDYGNTLDGWEGENWLDIRSNNVHDIMLTRLELAAEKGCDGVEPDNVDGYTNNTGFRLTSDDQLAYNRFLANAAHTRGLSIGLKNDLDQILELVEYFDFAVNEQCFQYNECELLTPFIDANKAVLTAEYQGKYKTEPSAREALCTVANELQFSTLILPLALDDSYRDSC